MKNVFNDNPIDLLKAAKPIWIVTFIILWNIIMFICIDINNGFSQIQTREAFLAFGFLGVFLLCSGAIPLISKNIKAKICRANIDPELGKSGLLLMSVFGTFFALIGFFCSLCI
jgi:hypothetical protein